MTNYQVLARKWRPKTFADLVGQQHVVKALQNALDKGRLHHAYLLTGTRGVGKTTIARILAKSLNCEYSQHGEPCGQCASCRDIDAGRFVDLLEIDAASNTGIDNIREVLDNAQYAPTAGKYKVYIIDEVHMLSKSAFNAMLKTLEEPPEHVKFILATTDPHKVPITILSRCLQFVLRNMTPQQVSEHLAHVLKSEQIVYEPAALTLLGRAAQGSMRDALSLLDQAIALGSGSVKERDVRHMIGAVDKRYLYELLTLLMEQNGEQLIAKAQEMASNAVGFDGALNDLAMLLQKLALIKLVPNAIAADDPERERLLHLSQYFSDEQIQLYYQCVVHGKQDLPLAPDEYAGFVMTLLRMLAFAPFAAKNTPIDATIEGSQLHDLAEKKNSLPVNKQNITETFRQPETVEPIEPIQFRPDQLPPAQREEIRRESPAEYLPENLSENPPETDSEFNIQIIDIIPIDDNFDYSEYSEYLDSLPEQGEDEEELEQEQEEETWQPEISTIQAPELLKDNWRLISEFISTRVSAAQMMLSHLAWVDFHEGVLTLALVKHKTKHSEQDDYFRRIETALSHVYQLPITLKVVDWEDNRGWETPAQYRERIAHEQRDAAYAALNQDSQAMALLAQFDGQWIHESVLLKSV